MPITQAKMALIVAEALDAHRAYENLASLVRDTLSADLSPSAKCALLATALEAVEAPRTSHAQNERAHIERTRTSNAEKARRQREKRENAV